MGVTGGFYIESNSGDTHIIGASEEGDMVFSSSNHVAVHVPGQQNALYVASGGGVAIGHNQPREQLDIEWCTYSLYIKITNLDASDGTIMYSATQVDF